MNIQENSRTGITPGRSCELRVGKEHFELSSDDVKAGSASSPDVVITIEPSVFLRLAAGKLDVARASAQSEIVGYEGLASDVFEILAGSAASGRP
jgi:putative sterol carrier protein